MSFIYLCAADAARRQDRQRVDLPPVDADGAHALLHAVGILDADAVLGAAEAAAHGKGLLRWCTRDGRVGWHGPP